MKNLNLSNDAADFINSLDKKKKKPLWDKIDRLVQGNKLEDVINFEDEKFFATINEFFIILKFDGKTIYIESIGRRDTALIVAPSSLPSRYSPVASALNKLKFDPNLFNLFILCCASTFFCLTMQRWFVLDLRVFAIMPLIPLLAYLSGTAIGLLHSGDKLFKFMPIALFCSVFLALCIKYIALSDKGFLTEALLQYSRSSSNMASFIAHSLVILVSMLVLLAAPFCFAACMGSQIGKLITNLRALTAYGFALFALLIGYLIFHLSSLICLTPAIQIAALVIGLLVLASRELTPRLPLQACLVLAAVAMFIPVTKKNSDQPIYFSPYHKIAASSGKKTDGAPFTVTLDDTLQETLMPESVDPEARLPFVLKQPKTLLILDAGIGTAAKEAVEQKIQSIDIVEKDPLLLKIGKQINSAYRSPSVHLHCQDPQSFVYNNKTKYDMIILACQNFVAPIGISSRTENGYEHTLEYYKKCLSLLDSDGILLLSFATSSYKDIDWLRNRFYVTAETASGCPPLVISKRNILAGFAPYIFVLSKNSKFSSSQLVHSLAQYTEVKMPSTVKAKIATDDCPYIFIKPGIIDMLYLLLSVCLITIVAWLGRIFIFSDANLLLNGEAVLLNGAFASMVLGSIARWIIIFGNNWITLVTIFSGILIIAIATNDSVRKSRLMKYEFILYGGLFISLTFSCFLPVGWFASLGLLGNLLITFFTIIPIVRVLYMISVVYSEAKEMSPLLAFGFLGLSFGLLLDYISIYSGQNSLLLISLALSGISFFLCLRRSKALTFSTATPAMKRIT